MPGAGDHPEHPAYAVVVGPQRRMLALLTDLAAEAGVRDTVVLAELLH